MLSILRHPFRFQCFYLVYQAVILYHEIETSDFPPEFGLGDFNSKGKFTCFLFLCRKMVPVDFPTTPFIVDPLFASMPSYSIF